MKTKSMFFEVLIYILEMFEMMQMHVNLSSKWIIYISSPDMSGHLGKDLVIIDTDKAWQDTILMSFNSLKLNLQIKAKQKQPR